MSTLFLSRFSLHRDTAVGALAPLLAPDGGEGVSATHRLIWAAFADDPDRKRDFLWRQEKSRRWLVLSCRPPSDPHRLFEIETKEFAPALAQGNRLAFALRANAVVTRRYKDGRRKRCDIVMDRLYAIPRNTRASERLRLAGEAGREWLIGQGARAGFRVDRAEVASYHTQSIPRHRQRPVELGMLDLEGEISVENPELFLPALAAGFGKAKAFGCGLMLIKRRA